MLFLIAKTTAAAFNSLTFNSTPTAENIDCNNFVITVTCCRATLVVSWPEAALPHNISSCLSRCLALASLALGFYCLRSGNYFNISLLVPCSCLPADTSRFILSLMLWNCFCLFIINILIQKCVVLIQLTYIEMAETLPSERIPTNHSENWTGDSPTLTEGHESNDSSYYLN